MAKKQAVVTPKDLLLELTGTMRRAASRPSVFGYRPMPHQQRFHSSVARGRLFIGGNRSGKTVSGGAESVRWLSGQHPDRPLPEGPIRGRGVSVDLLQGLNKIMLPEIARWVPPSLLKNGAWSDSYSASTRTLTLSNGNFMEFLTYEMELDKHAGTSRHFVWFDEEPPEEIFDENMLRLVDTGGSYWVTMTPVEGMTWVYDRLYLPGKNGIDPNIYVVEAHMELNTFINSAEIDIYLSGMDEETKQARKAGRFVQMGGLIYGNHFKDTNVIPSIINTEKWAPIRDKWTHFIALDHGFNNPTAVLWCAVDSDNRVLVYDEYYKEREIVAYHAGQIKERCKLLGLSPEYFVADPSIRNTDPITGTSVHLEYMEHGIPFMLGNNDVAAGIQRVARLFEDGTIKVTRNCEKLLWEIGRYRWATWASPKSKQNNSVKETPVKKDDHLMDALRYGIASRFSTGELLPAQVPNSQGFPESVDPWKPRYDLNLWSEEVIADPHLGSDF